MTEKAFREEDAELSEKGRYLSPQRRKELDLQVKLGKLALLKQILQQTELGSEEGQKFIQIGQQFEMPAATEKNKWISRAKS